MRRILLWAAVISWMGALGALPSYAQQPQPAAEADAGFDQHLDGALPLELEFRNEEGQAVRLGDYVRDRPVLLSFNYFHCTDLCPLMLEELTRTLGQLDVSLGEQYGVVTVSIDPTETVPEAAQKKEQLLASYGRGGAAAGWHFLLGAPTVLGVLAQAAGLRYSYDAGSKRYVHPLGILVLTPQGRIARYLYGLDIPARDVRLALVEAAQGRIGGLGDRVALLCYHYDPVSGSYSALAFDIARWVGAATVAGLALFLGSLWRRELRHAQRTAAGVTRTING